jgi:putative inorganic carbon (HCO3(-)) transporter
VVLYVWLLAGGARLIELTRRRDQAMGLALAASFVALFVHALFYSGFLEDPITWLVLGVGAGWVSWQRAQRSAAERARERAVA